MNRRLSLMAAAVVAATTLAACSGTGNDAKTETSEAASDLNYAVVAHGPAGDAFWDRVKAGAEQAGKDYGVKVNYSSDGDPAQQAQLIAGAVADKVDGLVVSMGNPEGLKSSISSAVNAKIPLVTINSGIEESKPYGAITHVGQSEEIAGKAVGERLKAEGFKKILCVVHAAGVLALETRCQAVAKVMGADAVENLQVDGTDDNAVTATLTSKLLADKSFDGVLTLGGQYAIDAVSAAKDTASDAKVATFDLSEDVLNEIKEGTIEWAVDQQPYVQGYLAITTLYLKDLNGNDVGGGEPIYSGPAFITKDNADQVLQFAKNGTR